MIELSHISKRFGALTALDNVSLQIHSGKIHGLLGENGAGKSTIMNVLFGLLRPDSGAIRINTREVSIPSPKAARTLGIGMVHQHFKLVPTLTVLENFALSLATSLRKIRPAAQRQLDSLRWNVPLNARIESLSVGQQQRVEITKALLAIEQSQQPTKALILDEPTAVLTPQEAAELFSALQTLKQSNTAIVFISHKLAEVQQICDEVTILRRGKHILTALTNSLSPAEMAEKMVGTTIELPRLTRETKPPLANTPPILELQNLSAGLLKSASLQLRPREILGIAGVDGNGQSDLVQAIIGSIPPTTGRISLDNQDATHKPIRWRIDRIAYIPEDRHQQAVVLPLTIRDNLLLKNYRRPPYSAYGWLRFPAWRSHARDLVTRFDIRTPSTATTVGRLSGGHPQKVVLARELADPQKPLVLAVNPTRGLDIGATAAVMQQLLNARNAGAAVLLIHSDLDELLALSDRLLVLYNGQLTPTHWPNTTREHIGQMMMGLPAQSQLDR
ncbi:MAG: ABC transporter ATP-binding protein [Phycisphaerae bacterium]